MRRPLFSYIAGTGLFKPPSDVQSVAGREASPGDARRIDNIGIRTRFSRRPWERGRTREACSARLSDIRGESDFAYVNAREVGQFLRRGDIPIGKDAE